MSYAETSSKINRALWVLATIIPILIVPIKGLPDIFNVAKAPVFTIGCIYIAYLLLRLKKTNRSPENIALLLYLLFVLAATILAYKPLLALSGTSYTAGRFEGFTTLFFYGILFYAAKDHLRITKKEILFFITVQSLVALYAVLQFYKIDPLVEYLNYTKGSYSTIGNQNFLASFCLLLLILSSGFYLKEKKWLLLIFPVLFFGAILASNTRGCWLAMIVVSVLSLFLLRYKKYWIYYLTLMATLVLVFVAMNYSSGSKIKHRTKTIKTELSLKDDKAGSGRVMIWMMSLDVIKKHPLFGAGPENLKEALKQTDNHRANEYYKLTGRTIDKAHNELLHIGAVSGLPALALYIVFISVIFIKNRKALFTGNIKTLLAFTIIAYLLQSLFNISVIAVAPLFWILLGVFAQNESSLVHNEAFI